MDINSYRLTENDEQIIIETILGFKGSKSVDQYAVRLAAIHALHCTVYDIRDSEIDWIDEQITALLEVTR